MNGQIEKILSEFKSLVEDGRFTISTRSENRQKNFDFMYEYDLVDKEKQKGIFLSIVREEFQKTEFSRNPNFPNEVIHIFVCTRSLTDHFGDDYDVPIYIKFQFVKNVESESFAVIISFHECEF